MNHLSQEQLVLYHYGEAPGRADLAEHLEACELCRANFRALHRVLASVDTLAAPERAEGYGAEVWRQLRPQIVRPTESRPMRLRWLFAWPRWIAAGALALALLGAFIAGRLWPRQPAGADSAMAQSSRHLSAAARERILLKEVGDHLERSQLALIELINSKTNGVVDISLEQALARQLVDVNRLYRQTAVRLGDRGMASVLEDLERALIEISNSPTKLSSTEFAEFRRRIDTDDMLFKVKVVGSQVRAKERDAARELAGKRS